jgi:Lrp/AsnC family transcriptional regulator for asnA, asnC and gidA
MTTETDIRIIKELQKNGRAAYAEIASAIGVNSATVAKRMESLIASNIMDVRAMLNPYELGLKAAAFIAIKTEIDQCDPVCEKLSSNFFVSTVLTMVSDVDIFCMVRYPTWERLNEFVTGEIGKMDGVIDYNCYYIKDTVKRYHQLFGDGLPFKEGAELKELDWKLIEQLTINGRISNSDLATKLGLHVSTISRRISSLLDRGIIKIMSQPNPAKFGFASSAIILACVNMRLCDRICGKIFPLDEVFLLLKVINRPYLIIGLHTKSNEMIVDVINNKVLNHKGIQKSDIYIRSKVIKSSYGWYLDDEYD